MKVYAGECLCSSAEFADLVEQHDAGSEGGDQVRYGQREPDSIKLESKRQQKCKRNKIEHLPGK